MNYFGGSCNSKTLIKISSSVSLGSVILTYSLCCLVNTITVTAMVMQLEN